MKTNSVLIIDDDEDDIFFLEECLSEMGIRKVHVALDGMQALTFLEKSLDCPPGLIILDFNMPKMNGIELLEKIKEKYDIPVIMYTTTCTDEIATKAKQNGAVGCFKKATNYDEDVKMGQRILKLLEKS